jgi:hypothetical protein
MSIVFILGNRLVVAREKYVLVGCSWLIAQQICQSTWKTSGDFILVNQTPAVIIAYESRSNKD